jgi:hypothetical protein
MDWSAINSSSPEDRKKVARQTRTFIPMAYSVIENHLLGKEIVGKPRKSGAAWISQVFKWVVVGDITVIYTIS